MSEAASLSEEDFASSSDTEADTSLLPDNYETAQRTFFAPSDDESTSLAFEESSRNNCTTRAQYDWLGKDKQTIDWTLLRRRKEDAREQRRDTYENYLNEPERVDEHWETLCIEQGKQVTLGAEFYEFNHFQRSPELSILHFQLRNLLWATSGFEFFFLSNNCIRQYNSLTHCSEEVLNMSASQECGQLRLDRVLVSTMCASHGLLAVGGFHGELILSTLDGKVAASRLMTAVESAITNGIKIFDSSNGVRLLAASNDDKVRLFDVEGLHLCSVYNVPWAANWACPSPNGCLVAVVGDHQDALVLDTRGRDRAACLKGHLDFSFAAAWHPDGLQIATGNQDTSTRIWDMRNLSESVCMLPGAMSAVRSLRYSPCGRFLAAAEAADYVRLYDTNSGYSRAQQIDFFSEISGVTFTPDGSAFMIGLQDNRWGGFMEFQLPRLEGGDDYLL